MSKTYRNKPKGEWVKKGRDVNHQAQYFERHAGRMGRREKTKYIAGPGGIGCNCCTCGNPGEAKPLIRRVERRKAKQNIQKEIDDGANSE